MVKYISMLMLVFCLCANTSTAAGPSIGLIVPYKVECVKQSDGTEQIRMSVCLLKDPKALVSEGNELTNIFFDPDNLSPATHVLQSQASCTELDAMYAINKKLYGYDAFPVGENATGVLDSGPNYKKNGTFCAFLINFKNCCKTKEDALKDIVLLDDTDVLKWVDVGTITAGSFSTVLSVAPYTTDQLIFFSLYGTGTGEQISILDRILSTAVLNLHGKPCCFETFGLNPADAKGVLLQIIKGLDTTPGDFTATGTWGSCGDTAKVKVTGVKKSKTVIDVCGKKLCFQEDAAVAGSGDAPFFPYNSTVGFKTTRCFYEFVKTYIASGLNAGLTAEPLFLTYGLQDELCRLIDGRPFHISDGKDITTQLHLLCVDPATNTYGFAVTDKYEDGANATNLHILGCRFQLVECPKCCK